MKNTPRFFKPVCRATLAAGCLLLSAGCGEHSPGEDDDDHVGHVIPAHKPKAFPQAVHRLRDLNDQFIRDGVAGQGKSSPDEKTLHMALDIANWLPEIAADSDMPEAPWDEVNARSATIVADYRAIVSGDAGEVRGEVEHAGAEIARLETLLASCDPRWFAGPERAGEAALSTSTDVNRP